jgi:hypothetical protein
LKKKKPLSFFKIFTNYNFSSFFKNGKDALTCFQNSHRFFVGRSRLDATVLMGIVSKGATKFELKFLQVHIKIKPIKFLPLRKSITLCKNLQNSTS